MQICRTIEDALQVIQAHTGSASELALTIANSLNDEAGMNMAILTDSISAKGWAPDGFEDLGDYRIYRYTNLD